VTQYLGNALIEVIALVNGQSFEVSSLTAECMESLGIDGNRRALQEANGDDGGPEETPALPVFQVFSPDGTQIIDIDGNSGSDSNSDGTDSSGGTQAPTPTPRKPIYETVDEIDVIVKDTDSKVDGIQDVLTPMKTTVDGMSNTIGIKIDASVAPIETSVSNTESAVNVIHQNVLPMKTTIDGMSNTIGIKIDASVAPIETSVSNTESAVNLIHQNVLPMKTTIDDMSSTVGGIQDVLTPMKTTVDGIGSKIDTSVAPIESAVSFMQGEVNNIKEQVQEIHEINALMHEILNRTLAPTLSPSQSPSRSVSCKVVPFVFHTQYIPHLTTCYLFLYIHMLRFDFTAHI